MSFLFNDFKGWKAWCEQHDRSLCESVVEYEVTQKERPEALIWSGLGRAYKVMKDAVKTSLTEDMT